MKSIKVLNMAVIILAIVAVIVLTLPNANGQIVELPQAPANLIEALARARVIAIPDQQWIQTYGASGDSIVGYNLNILARLHNAQEIKLKTLLDPNQPADPNGRTK